MSQSIYEMKYRCKGNTSYFPIVIEEWDEIAKYSQWLAQQPSVVEIYCTIKLGDEIRKEVLYDLSAAQQEYLDTKIYLQNLYNETDRFGELHEIIKTETEELHRIKDDIKKINYTLAASARKQLLDLPEKNNVQKLEAETLRLINEAKSRENNIDDLRYEYALLEELRDFRRDEITSSESRLYSLEHNMTK